MPINAATRANLLRKSAYVDKVQVHKGVPLFSWVDLSLTELCNRSKGHPRACTFCPRIDPTFYPNQNIHIDFKLIERIAQELYNLDYQGVVVLCGYGEPLLHPQIEEIVTELQSSRVEIVTNGDFLGPEKTVRLFDAGVSYFVVSLYDGPHQVEKFHKLFKECGISEQFYILRDRWHPEADQFGLKLTNRAGTVTVGPQDPVDTHRPCYYTSYQLQVDWNGDVLLCPQDWHKRLKFGNISAESMFDIWTSTRMQKHRKLLQKGLRSNHPCNLCNVDGTLHGEKHVAEWTKKE